MNQSHQQVLGEDQILKNHIDTHHLVEDSVTNAMIDDMQEAHECRVCRALKGLGNSIWHPKVMTHFMILKAGESSKVLTCLLGMKWYDWVVPFPSLSIVSLSFIVSGT